MRLFPWLRFAVTKNRNFNYIVVYTVYISVGVVNAIVFDLPDKLIATQKIHAVSNDVVQLWVRRKCSVTSIMHDIHTNQRQSEAKKGTY